MYIAVIVFSFYFLHQSNFVIVCSSELFLSFQLLKFHDSFSADKLTLYDNKLPEDPFKKITDDDQIHNCYSIKSAIF